MPEFHYKIRYFDPGEYIQLRSGVALKRDTGDPKKIRTTTVFKIVEPPIKSMGSVSVYCINTETGVLNFFYSEIRACKYFPTEEEFISYIPFTA